MSKKWSKPYYGIEHRLDIPKSHQITMNCNGPKARVYMLYLHGNSPFTTVKEFIGTRSECERTADEWAASLASSPNWRKNTMKTKWEYLITLIDLARATVWKYIEQKSGEWISLDDFGKEGWELIQVIESRINEDDMQGIFKRPLEDK